MQAGVETAGHPGSTQLGTQRTRAAAGTGLPPQQGWRVVLQRARSPRRGTIFSMASASHRSPSCGCRGRTGVTVNRHSPACAGGRPFRPLCAACAPLLQACIHHKYIRHNGRPAEATQGRGVLPCSLCARSGVPCKPRLLLRLLLCHAIILFHRLDGVPAEKLANGAHS